MTPFDVANAAFIATRRKLLLTAADRERLTAMRAAYRPGGLSEDPHLTAAIDDLLAP